MYTIGEFSKLNRITAKTLRHYDRIGLLKAFYVDKWTGYRYYDVFFDIVPKMGEHMKETGAVCREPAYCFTIYHDGEYKEEDIDVEICEAVTSSCPDTGPVRFKELDAVEQAATMLHKGPYKTIGSTYSRLTETIWDKGLKISGPPRESYIDGIWNKEDPEEWLTEIQIPVE